MHRLPAAEPAALPEAMVPRPHRVAVKRQETHDTWTLELEPEEAKLAPFAPGQFAMIYAFGVGEIPISICSNPARPGALVHTIRAVGPVSGAICATDLGATVGVRGPFGVPWPIAEREGSDVVVVAGGLGLAPLRPVIDFVLADRQRYGRLVVLYGGRSPAELLFVDALQEWRARFDVEVAVTVDAAGSDWLGKVGVVPSLVARADFDPETAVAMIVGPEVMIRFTVEALHHRGMSSEDIYVSLERNMQCAVGHCGHCQIGPLFVCKDGPVFRHDAIGPWLKVREL
jgi:NAD(P)H-flavin reductase